MSNRVLGIKEKIVLLNFLKSNCTTRELDELLGFNSAKSRGWTSWEILKKYHLENLDRGKLFCFRERESINIINAIINCKERAEVQTILNTSRPQHLENYRDTYITADTDIKVYFVLQSEVRNITQSFFSPHKKLVGKCQYDNCGASNLDTVHLRKSRPEIFKLACMYGRISGSKKYDVYMILRQYLQLHSKKKSICFLCKKHHQELTLYEKEGGRRLKAFRSKIGT